MKRFENRKILSSLLCIVLVAAMAFSFASCKDEKTNEPSDKAPSESISVSDDGTAETTPSDASGAVSVGEGNTTFSFTVEDGDKHVEYSVSTDKTVVGDALVEIGLIAGEAGPYGLYVKTVDGATYDYEKDGKYWAFYVDGEYAMSGVEKTAIETGHTYMFKCE